MIAKTREELNKMTIKEVDNSSLFQQYQIVEKAQNFLIDGALFGAITLVVKNSLQSSFTCSNPYVMALLLGAVCYRSETIYNAVMKPIDIFSRFVGHLCAFHQNVSMFFESINSLGKLFYLMSQPFSFDKPNASVTASATPAATPIIDVQEYLRTVAEPSILPEEPPAVSDADIFQEFYGGPSQQFTHQSKILASRFILSKL
jgi:hypothetical protein